MAVSKKDFNAVANVLKDIPNELDVREAFTKEEVNLMKDTKSIIGRELADYFMQENPRFDRRRFLSASNIDEVI